MLDLNVLLGKHITAPLLLYICYLIYEDVTSAKKGDKQSPQEPIPEKREDSAPVNATAQLKWQPIQLMQSIEPISSEPDYKPWEKNEPYPYKPFKPGEYRLTMGVRTLPLENWLVLEEDVYKRQNHNRQREILDLRLLRPGVLIQQHCCYLNLSR